jgi:hypothetical protein
MNEMNYPERFQTCDSGPQSPSDHPFTAKARKLQSLWRAQNGLEMGVGPNRNSNQLYGNIIKDGETSGRNFFYPETFAYARWRVDTKLKDETIDEYRLFNNLMSSMPMAFNLFHPLMMLKAENPLVLDNMIRAAFPNINNIYKVLEIGLEFIPTPIEHYTGDKSAMDAFIRFQDKGGNNYLIAIETKYTDSLGTNTTSKKDVYKHQLELLKELNIFTPEAVEGFESGKIVLSQLYRNFLLAEVYGRKQGFKEVFSVILAPKDHPSTKHEIQTLREHLKKGFKDKVLAISLEDFIENLRLVGSLSDNLWLNWFWDRYLNFGKLENLCRK